MFTIDFNKKLSKREEVIDQIFDNLIEIFNFDTAEKALNYLSKKTNKQLNLILDLIEQSNNNIATVMDAIVVIDTDEIINIGDKEN